VAELPRSTLSIPTVGALREPDDVISFATGEHLCALYGSDSGRDWLAAPFLIQGLREGSTVFLVGQGDATSAILEQVTRSYPDLQRDIDASRLYVTENHPTAREQIDYFKSRIASATQSGVKSFRVFGDMVGFRKTMAPDVLVAFEEQVDAMIVRQHPVIVMCAYDVRAFSGVEIISALKGHGSNK